MIYNVDSRLQVFLLLAQLKIQISARARMGLFYRFKIHTVCLRLANVMNKHGLHLLKHRGHLANACYFFGPPTFAVMMLPSCKHN
jgi:hypothetical protein